MQTAPPNCGLLFFEKLHGSIEDKFPCRYFWGRVKNKNQTIWVYSEKFAFQILNFFKMSISEPVFSLQTHIHLFMRYLQQIQYLTTRFFCIDPKRRAEAEEGYRRSSSSRWQPYVNKASINTARKVLLEIQAVFLLKNP